METINHFLNLNKYICENYCSLNYDWNYLFSESVVQLFLEMKITPERLELARELGFDKFLVGSESSKESLVVEFGSLKVAEDAEVVDTTEYSIEEVYNILKNIILEHGYIEP